MADETKPAELLKWDWLLLVAALASAIVALNWWPDSTWNSVRQSWMVFHGWSNRHLLTVTEGSPLLVACLPCAAMLVMALALQLIWDRPPNWVRLPVAIIFLILQGTYLLFRVSSTLSFDTLPNAILGILYFLVELLAHVRIAIGNFSLLRITNRSAAADESARLVKSGKYVPSVDVFIPTYSEPVEMLRRTIVGCQAMDYPNKTVWLLDDTRRPQMRMLAEELGCRYLDRPDNSHAKAGNLNHAMTHSTGELAVFFDADFIPTSDFLERTVGFFQDPSVAMVQTPQNFFNEDAVARNLGVGNALEDEQRLFFRTLQPARDASNAIVCHGSCFVARRPALDDIGGIPTETITEDWATSIRLQAAGYKLYYLNEALSAGMAADTCGEFVQQRARWAQGTLQGLFASTHPLRVTGLTWRQRALHMASILYYLGSVSNIVTLILPLLFFFGNVLVMKMTLPEMIFYRLPFTLGYYLLYSWLTLRTRSPFWSELYDAFLSPTMGLTVLRSLVRPFGIGFRVTNKAQRTRESSVNWQIATPFAVLLVLHVLAIAFAVGTHKHIEYRDMFWIVALSVGFNVSLLWMCLLVCVDVARASPHHRFERKVPFTLSWEGGSASGTTVAISDEEVFILSTSLIAEVPCNAKLTISELGFDEINVRIVTGDKPDRIGLLLPQLPLEQYRRLITELYCQPGQWDGRPKGEMQAAWEYFRAGLRMYPLAEAA